MELSNPNLKILLYSRRELEKPENKKFLIFLSHFMFVERELLKQSTKEKSFLYFPL